jgi:hypothetical protein
VSVLKPFNERTFCLLSSLAVLLFSGSQLGAQTTDTLKDSGSSAPSSTGADVPSKRIFGIVPNYRTSASLHPYAPISDKEKIKIGLEDAFDRGTFVLAAAFAGEAQLSNSNRAFGQGAAGYGSYLGASYADYVIGDMFTESAFPILLHQDPRYFRKGEGSAMSRLSYALSRIVVTQNDSGKTGFNYSEIIGNSSAVAISTLYYVDNLDAKDATVKLTSQLGVDAAANVLKEFWPDLQKKLRRKH